MAAFTAQPRKRCRLISDGDSKVLGLLLYFG
jgi:hypothetical protein